MKSSFAIPLFERFAKERGIAMHVEPTYRFVAQLTLSDGTKRYVSTHLDCINGAAATEIARDKTYTLYFLKLMGYAVPEGRAFFTRSYADFLGSDQTLIAAWRYAVEIGLPIILKPNSKSQGRGVWKIESKQEFETAIRDLENWVDIYRIERYCSGRDYRIVVYDGEVICAYERTPLSICGDGVSTVEELMVKKQEFFLVKKRSVSFDARDRRIQWILKRNALSPNSVLENGRVLMLLGNANLSSGGDMRDATNTLCSAYAELALNCSKDMGLRLCGMDILIDGDETELHPYTILEVNAGPGLANYASLGDDQRNRVENMYRNIFDTITSPR